MKAFLAGVALALVGCGGRVADPIGASADARDVPAHRGGTLRTATFADVRSLDPHVSLDGASGPVLQLLYATLIKFARPGQGKDGGNFAPDLASDWRVADDGRRVTFTLRRGAKFHDGSDVLAGDVKRGLERALAAKTPNPGKSFYERIEGFDAYSSGKAESLAGVVVLGDHELAIDLTEPDATLLSVLTMPLVAPLCPSAGRAWDRDFGQHPCGAGPFSLNRWDAGRAVVLDRFDGWYEPGKPYVDRIEWSVLVPPFTQRLKFERGELDMLRDFSESDLSLFRRAPLWKDRGEWEAAKTVGGLFMNTEIAPFDNVELRRAVQSALDPDELAATRPSTVRPASRRVPSGIPGYDPRPGAVHDEAAALEHMRLAGYPFDPGTGRGGYPKEITFDSLGDSFYGQAAEVTQQELARVGIRIKLRLLGWPAYLAETSRRHLVSIGTDAWSADFPDPSDFYEPLLHSRAIAEEESQNRAFYSNKQFDELLDRARRATDFGERVALYRQAEDLVLRDAPSVMSYSIVWFELWQPYVRGYHVNALRQQDLATAWVDEVARGGAAKAPISAFLPGKPRPAAIALRAVPFGGPR